MHQARALCLENANLHHAANLRYVCAAFLPLFIHSKLSSNYFFLYVAPPIKDGLFVFHVSPTCKVLFFLQIPASKESKIAQTIIFFSFVLSSVLSLASIAPVFLHNEKVDLVCVGCGCLSALLHLPPTQRRHRLNHCRSYLRLTCPACDPDLHPVGRALS